MANGYFSSSKHAYETLLKKGRKAFINREGLSAEEAIELIHECGGKSFLAHPGIYDWEFSLSDLLEAGLNGIEVYYSQHNDHDTNKWLELAKRNQLLVSVGSDFHGYQSRSPYPIGSVDYNEKQLEWVFAQLEEEVRK
ncbi:hypothetical protein [Bacillus sp. JCM 19034]|uniref:hypothetical protein n=1 Tax=Bacillus sp. JCM 19034 TaxID=1481928 RepID=UPI000B29174E|nr:hypothetical protein [Bacillus sp. JCM 19034]